MVHNLPGRNPIRPADSLAALIPKPPKPLYPRPFLEFRADSSCALAFPAITMRRPLPPAALLLAFLAGCTPATTHLALSHAPPAIELNEAAIRGWRNHAPPDPGSIASPVPAPDFQSPRSVLAFVLSQLPPCSTVFPTERYFYYRFPLADRVISGNIRFVDAESGGISVGYFDAYNNQDLGTGVFQDGRDAVSIRYTEASHQVDISIDGISRSFVLDQEAFDPPSFPLLPGEQLISGVRDESGYFLYLIYWQPGRSFYYLLNPAKPLPETWSRADAGPLDLRFGDRSRFCFLRHPQTGRFILVGVHRREIELNSWYDGPFDQVPPHLPIRAILEEAYPYVKDAGGIDEHGNFLQTPGQRVAISPYANYSSGPQLVHDLQNAVIDDPTPAAWTTATYEYKRDWRPPSLEPAPGGHLPATSSSWPANHWGASSSEWGPDHLAATSSTWPPNHASAASRSTPAASPPAPAANGNGPQR